MSGNPDIPDRGRLLFIDCTLGSKSEPKFSSAVDTALNWLFERLPGKYELPSDPVGRVEAKGQIVAWRQSDDSWAGYCDRQANHEPEARWLTELSLNDSNPLRLRLRLRYTGQRQMVPGVPGIVKDLQSDYGLADKSNLEFRLMSRQIKTEDDLREFQEILNDSRRQVPLVVGTVPYDEPWQQVLDDFDAFALDVLGIAHSFFLSPWMSRSFRENLNVLGCGGGSIRTYNEGFGLEQDGSLHPVISNRRIASAKRGRPGALKAHAFRLMRSAAQRHWAEFPTEAWALPD